MSKKFVDIGDKFRISCKNCLSEDIDYWCEECGECGSHIYMECNKCKQKFKYHDFEQVEENTDKIGESK